jgi:hypothetical protein
MTNGRRAVALTLGLMTAGLAWAAQSAAGAAPSRVGTVQSSAQSRQTVEVLDAAGRVVASGPLGGHLVVTGRLSAGQTLRVSSVQGGVTSVQTFVLAAPITTAGPEAERLSVRLDGQILTLDAALEHAGRAGDDHAASGRANEAARGGADDGAGHDAGDDHGGAAGGGHGADDGGGAADGAGHDAGDDHGGGGGSGNGGSGGGEHGGGHK